MLARAIDVIDRNASAQLTLVTDMLDMARITAGKVRLDLSDIDLRDDRRFGGGRHPSRGGSPRHRDHHRSAGRPGDGARRRGPVAAGLLEPAIERRQVHRRRRPCLDPARRGGQQPSRVDHGHRCRHLPEFISQVFQRFKQADPSAARRHGGLGQASPWFARSCTCTAGRWTRRARDCAPARPSR